MKSTRLNAQTAFGFTAAAALGWFGPTAFAQLAGDQPVIYVCAAGDGVLRLIPPGASCPAGESRLRLKRAEGDLEPPKSDADSGKGACPDSSKLEELARRLQDLEDATSEGGVTKRVTEPFEVVDRQGRKILSVVHEDDTSSNVLRLFNAGDPKSVAQMRASAGGGYFMGRSSAGKLFAAIGAGAGQVSVVIGDENDSDQQHTGDRVRLGLLRGQQNYQLQFLSAGGNKLASIGESAETRAGVASVFDTRGTWRAAMMYSGFAKDKGVLAIGGGGPKQIAELAEGSNGGGVLRLYTGQGTAIVEAGVTAEQFGVVRAGPESFKPGLGLLGLPGSYISGKPN